MIRLTQRAFLLGVVALCLYLVAVVNVLQSFYYVLVWLAVALLVASLGIALLSLTGTTCELRERRAQGYARGEFNDNKAPPLWETSLGNTGSLNKIGLQIELRLQNQQDAAIAKSKTVLFAARFLVEALPAGTSLDAPLVLDFLPRGVYSLRCARLIGSDVMGLFLTSKRLVSPSIPLQVVVAPPVLPAVARRDFARGGGGRDGSRALAHLGAGEDLRGVRPYVPGDDWRHVHWATTARTGELAVREFERNGRGAALVVWDGALSPTTSPTSSSSIEEELCLVTSLLCVLDTGQISVSVAVLGREEEFVPAGGSEGMLSHAALTALARAKSERTQPLSQALARARSGGEGRLGQLFFVSSSLRGDLVDCVAACAGRGEAPVVALCEVARPIAATRPNKSARPTEVISPFELQERALVATGARVVRVSLVPGEAASSVLERALFEMLEL